MITISPVSDHVSALGEGPLWDVQSQTLHWVDSLGPTLFRLDYASGAVTVWELDGSEIGSLAVRQSGGLILAMDHGFYGFCPETGTLDLISEPLAGLDGVRFNDGKVDNAGAFIAGGMNIRLHDLVDCPAYRLRPDLSVEKILDGFDVFNGPCFNLSGDRMYFTGRGDNTIEVVQYTDSGPLSGASDFYVTGIPDGATVDAEDHVWSAQWTHECILRLTPHGEIERRVDVPGQTVTSVMFGGPELDLLYVTTLGKPLRGAVPQNPLAGRTLVIEGLGVCGRAEPRFLG